MHLEAEPCSGVFKMNSNAEMHIQPSVLLKAWQTSWSLGLLPLTEVTGLHRGRNTPVPARPVVLVLKWYKMHASFIQSLLVRRALA